MADTLPAGTSAQAPARVMSLKAMSQRTANVSVVESPLQLLGDRENTGSETLNNQISRDLFRTCGGGDLQSKEYEGE